MSFEGIAFGETEAHRGARLSAGGIDEFEGSGLAVLLVHQGNDSAEHSQAGARVAPRALYAHRAAAAAVVRHANQERTVFLADRNLNGVAGRGLRKSVLQSILYGNFKAHGGHGARAVDAFVNLPHHRWRGVVGIFVQLHIILHEGYLVDICIIYALISFLTVIVLTKVYMGVYLEKKEAENRQKKTGKEEEA